MSTSAESASRDAAVRQMRNIGLGPPADFHRQLLDWLAGAGKGFVATFDLGHYEVWSYPAYRFETEWTTDASTPGIWHVQTTTLWMANMRVPPDQLGTMPFPNDDGLKMEYDLTGDPWHPTGGSWRANLPLSHPGRIWYLQPLARNAGRELTSPSLSRHVIQAILDREPAA